VISSPRGTFLRIKATDHAHITMPGIRMAIEIARRASAGPPTSNQDGYADVQDQANEQERQGEERDLVRASDEHRQLRSASLTTG
jgi:hypothetical protein